MQGLKMFVILKLFHFPSWDRILSSYESSSSIAKYWIFDPGCWMFDPVLSISDSGCWILNPKGSMLSDSDRSILNPRYWIFSSKSWMFDAKRDEKFWAVS